MSAPAYPHGGDPARRARLAYMLCHRRRISNELDDLLGVTGSVASEIDYRATGLSLDVPEREAAGRRLLAIGWLP